VAMLPVSAGRSRYVGGQFKCAAIRIAGESEIIGGVTLFVSHCRLYDHVTLTREWFPV
jgi:hypothetical protein